MGSLFGRKSVLFGEILDLECATERGKQLVGNVFVVTNDGLYVISANISLENTSLVVRYTDNNGKKNDYQIDTQNTLKCFSLKKDEKITFHWINNSQIETECFGRFHIARLYSTYNITGSMIDLQGAKNGETKQLFQWLCLNSGLYLFTFYFIMESDVILGNFACIFRKKEQSLTKDVPINLKKTGSFYRSFINLSCLFMCSQNDNIELWYKNNSSTEAMGFSVPLQGYYMINKVGV